LFRVIDTSWNQILEVIGKFAFLKEVTTSTIFLKKASAIESIKSPSNSLKCMSDIAVLVAILLVFAALAIAIYYYFEKTKNSRLRKIRKEKTISPQDEAYNKVKRAKGVTKVLKRKGKETDDATELVNKAEEALGKGDHSKAEKLAEKAQKKLSKNSGDKEEEMNEKKKKGYTIDELDDIEFEETDEAKKRREELEKQKEKLKSLPENYLESKFEMKRVKELVDEEEDEEAEKYYKEAERRFEDEDYTGALKYTVRCRKVIRGEDPELIAFKDDGKKEASQEFIDDVREIDEHVEKTPGESKKSGETDIYASEERNIEETVSKQKKFCPDCGFEGGEDDNFCPKCGTELILKNQCHECGAEIKDEHRFCSKCGTEIKETGSACPDCGKEVDEDDEFCPKCGTKI